MGKAVSSRNELETSSFEGEVSLNSDVHGDFLVPLCGWPQFFRGFALLLIAELDPSCILILTVRSHRSKW